MPFGVLIPLTNHYSSDVMTWGYQDTQMDDLWKVTVNLWGSHPANNAGFSDGSFGMLNGKQKKPDPKCFLGTYDVRKLC